MRLGSTASPTSVAKRKTAVRKWPTKIRNYTLTIASIITLTAGIALVSGHSASQAARTQAIT